jgi:hypothetical protein
MIRTINVSAEITSTRELLIRLPDDVPTGPAEMVLVVSTLEKPKPATLGDFVESEFFGMWQGRDDIDDSLEFARRLREEGWKRSA